MCTHVITISTVNFVSASNRKNYVGLFLNIQNKVVSHKLSDMLCSASDQKTSHSTLKMLLKDKTTKIVNGIRVSQKQVILVQKYVLA